MGFVGFTALTAACSNGPDDSLQPAPTAESTPSPTPAPRDPQAAQEAFQRFVTAVQQNRLEDAWVLYAASIPGNTAEHRAERGCDFNVFSFEFPTIQYLFQQIAPLSIVETFGSALGLSVVELRIQGANGTDYLATLARAEPYDEGYQVMFLNSGQPAAVPGAPDPFPSPEYPGGFCGIWTGAR